MTSPVGLQRETNQANRETRQGFASFWEGATFLPFDQPSRTDILVEEVWKVRQATLLGLGLKLSEKEPELYIESGLADSLTAYLRMSAKERRRITEYPPFRIWLKQSLRLAGRASNEAAARREDLHRQLAELARILGEFRVEGSDSTILSVEGTSIKVARYTVDPLLATAIPPSYNFPAKDAQPQLEAKTAYSLQLFLEAADAALDRIHETWLPAYQDFARFVRMIIHLPEADFRSCSADRYAGVILLSAGDGSLLELEESLIHEYGHQILYNVMELDPLILNPSGGRYTLPWSGAERDLYGYFHAFYIYLLLVHYFERVGHRSETDRKRASERMAHILAGLIQALPELGSASHFTLRGKRLFALLQEDVQRFQLKHQMSG